ncbi:MAG: LVIVD repeat-containing protein [Rhodospirillales bacterium]|jgi:hypothetical protein
MSKAEAHNIRLISQHTLDGYGGLGEGMAINVTKDGRRIMWLAHEGPPKNFTGVDVTDPKNPKITVQTDLPHMYVRSNSLDVCGDIMAVCYQTMGPTGLVSDPGLGGDPAGIELFDISDPENPKSLSFFDCSGPGSMGVHQCWFVDGKYIHFSGGAPDFESKHPNDCQFYRSIDVSDPTKPVEVGRWWYPGTRKEDKEPMPKRVPPFEAGFRTHNTNVYPAKNDRAYLAYLDGGVIVLDISDMANPKMITHWNPYPPFPGFMHTVMPLISRDLLICSEECTKDGGADWPKRVWILDAREETNLVPISTLPMPPVEDFARRGGRFGAHNLHENRPGDYSFRSDTILFTGMFNAGMRVYDTSDPFEPKEIAYYIPETPEGSRAGAVQINDVYVDETGLLYGVDRFTGGLYICEVDI